MDDLKVTTTTLDIQARSRVLSALEDSFSLAHMKFKAKKSQCLLLRKGRVDIRHITMQIQGEEIPSIVGNLIKCLGKWFNESLKDKESIEDTKKNLLFWLRIVDGSGLPGKYKAWIYQHGILPRLMCLLLIYEIATTTVEAMERKESRYLRRWLGVPSSFTSIGFYSNSIQLSLPVSSVVEEFKVAKCRLVITLQDSADNRIAGAGIQTRKGRKWSAKTSVDQAESMLQLRDIIGNTNTGQQAVGMSHFQQWSKA